MLNSAKKMIVSELVLVDDQSVEEVENSIERAVLKREII
jgi:RNA polymerase-interacting CarD/CdnL/TRCF family regulator